jgi:hypothetical protein
MILYINRGLPGSGKSTRTRQLAEYETNKGKWVVICSTDDYFVCPSCKAYHFDRDRLGAAHRWCQNKAHKAMHDGVDVVIIDNTNVTARECRVYVDFAMVFGYEVRFLEPTTPWAFDVDELVKKNVHGVSREALERMLVRYVPEMTIEKALGKPQPGPMTADEQAASQKERDPCPATA